mmetsp:Transcript_31354/g.51766  ORF Transcript_31354/g.51766 Transcript_31354/m.51766 type:complete len:310 (-) Transcript_31354:10-939(-)
MGGLRCVVLDGLSLIQHHTCPTFLQKFVLVQQEALITGQDHIIKLHDRTLPMCRVHLVSQINGTLAVPGPNLELFLPLGRSLPQLALPNAVFSSHQHCRRQDQGPTPASLQLWSTWVFAFLRGLQSCSNAQDVGYGLTCLPQAHGIRQQRTHLSGRPRHEPVVAIFLVPAQGPGWLYLQLQRAQDILHHCKGTSGQGPPGMSTHHGHQKISRGHFHLAILASQTLQDLAQIRGAFLTCPHQRLRLDGCFSRCIGRCVGRCLGILGILGWSLGNSQGGEEFSCRFRRKLGRRVDGLTLHGAMEENSKRKK